MIWTGTNEIMDLVIQHEYYKELLGRGPGGRDVESDAEEVDRSEEKVYGQRALSHPAWAVVE